MMPVQVSVKTEYKKVREGIWLQAGAEEIVETKR
jgi:hypothetical protein